MMLYFWKFQWLWLHFVLYHYIKADWLSLDSCGIQLLGLFLTVSNTSQLSTMPIQTSAMFKAAILLSHQYNITIGGQYIGWQSVQTAGDVIGAFRSSCLAVSATNIVGIVGPAYSSESHVIAPFAEKINIPVISYSATDLELSDRNTYPAFYRTVPSDDAAALSITQLFIQFNWTSCIIIYQNDAFGSGGAKAINEAFLNHNLTVTETIVFDISTLTLRNDIKSVLVNSASRIVLVWALPDYIALILQNALDNDVIGPYFTWILSSTVPLNTFNQTYHDKLIGILTIEPVVGSVVNASINTTLLNAAYNIWQQYEPDTFPGSNNVNYYALFAFDATWTLIQALQKFCSTMSNNSPSCISFTNTSFCFDRQLLNSSSLFDAITSNSFLGVTGSIKFSPNITDRVTGIYYMAKNVQLFANNLNYVPVLTWSDSNGWSSYTPTAVIIWPGVTLTTPSSYAVVSGMTLRIAVVQGAPFTMVQETPDDFGNMTTKLVGYIPDLIQRLQIKMKFKANIILVPITLTYNDLVDAVANGVYDMVVADMTVTAARRQKVAFSSSIFDTSLRVIIRKVAITDVDFLSYLRPFSFKLWIVLLITSLYAGFLICLLERYENEALRERSISSLIVLSMWFSVGTLFGYGADFHVRTAAGRLLTVGLYILSLILVAAYTANLASDLTISKSTYSISGIEDIKNGKIPFSRIGIVTGTSIEGYYLREISGNNRNFYPLKSSGEIYRYLLDNIIDASIMDAGLLEYLTSNVYCNLTLVGADFDKNSFAIIFHKKWLYAHYLDVNILSLREAGVLDDLKRKWFQANYCSALSKTSTAMTIESMAGLFLTFGVISILAMFVFAWTERLILKNYLSKKLSVKINMLWMRKTNESSTECTPNSNLSSSPIMYL